MNETEQINRKIPVVLQKQGISRTINEKGRGRNAIFQDLTLIILIILREVWDLQGADYSRLDKGACLAVKNIGKPCAGKPHARFDEGGLAS